MKVLFSSYHNPNFFTITEYIENAIRSLENAIFIFDDRQHLFPGRLRNSIKLLKYFDRKHINKKFVSLALAKNPDIALIGGGDRISLQSVQILNNNGIKTVLWTTDPPRNFEPILNAASTFQHIFCQGTEAIQLFEKANIKNAKWLPMACDPFFHHPVQLTSKEQDKYGNDIVFVGSYYPNRYSLFKKLSGYDFGLWGPGWDKAESSDLRSHFRGEHTRPSEWLKIYSACKIVLTPHYQDPENKFPVYQASPRIFEAMACGAFVISDYQKDVFTLFKDGKHLVGFKDEDELIEKIEYYLKNPDERNAIAKCGRQEVLRNHKYVDRIERLLSVVDAN
jgi:spore maturation protein CgeB